jgi:hypothetical protein
VKYDGAGNLDKFKARLVALGYVQKPEVDYEEIFSPVCKIRTIYNIMLAGIAVQNKLLIQSLDYTSAFLNAKIDMETYIKLPSDIFRKYYKNNIETENLFRLKRALYGLHQSPMLWFNTIKNFILKLNYTQSL